MISSVIDIEERRRVLQALPEDWYVDHDGSHATRPTQDAIDKACAAAERAIRSGLLVEYIDADANGGTCVTMRGEQEMDASIYFRNGGSASAVSLEPGERICEPLTDDTWPKLVAKLAGRAPDMPRRSSGGGDERA